MEIIKDLVMEKKKTKEELGWINQTFKKERLIARDDGERYFQNESSNSKEF